MIKKVEFTLVLMLFGTVLFGQTPTITPPPNSQRISSSGGPDLPPPTGRIPNLIIKTPQSLEAILTEAEKQTVSYQEAFKNLLAIETKTFEEYGKNGDVKNQTVVESNFLVYQSSKNQNISSELRNVIKVDGKAVPDSQSRSDRLFAELQKASTYRSELEKIQKEGNRYDKTLVIDGVTLFEGVALLNNLRPFFDFKLVGTETYQGSDCFVVSYLQTKKSPYITLNSDDGPKNEMPTREVSLGFKFDLPKSLKNSDAFLNGKLWIDAKTFRIRREERFLTVNTEEPVIVLESIFEYQPSNYEIFVPKRISIVINEVRKQDNKNVAVKDIKVDFDYSEFRKSETDVKILDDTEEK